MGILLLNGWAVTVAKTHGIDVVQHAESIGEGPNFGGVRQIAELKIDLCHVRFLHIFLNIDPFLMIFVPFESSQSQLSNGTKIIKNGSILRKI